jgi:hypothetical protein
VCLPVVAGIKCLRGVCNERLKYEVEYSLKKGTSENSYLLSVSTATAAAAADLRPVLQSLHSSVGQGSQLACWQQPHAIPHSLQWAD